MIVLALSKEAVAGGIAATPKRYQGMAHLFLRLKGQQFREIASGNQATIAKLDCQGVAKQAAATTRTLADNLSSSYVSAYGQDAT